MCCLLSEYFELRVQTHGCGNTSRQQQRGRHVMKYADFDADDATAAATIPAIVCAA